MPAALSLDLRERVVRELETTSKTQLEVAAQFRIGVATVKRLVRRKRETGGLAPKVNRGPVSLRKIREDGQELIRTWLTVEPDLTNWELADRYTMETGVTVSPATISRTLARMDWTRKKRR